MHLRTQAALHSGFRVDLKSRGVKIVVLARCRSTQRLQLHEPRCSFTTVYHQPCNPGGNWFCSGALRRVYIEAEEKGLRETLEALIREESWKPMEDAAQTNVLRSASELFAVIKKSLQRCARFVSRGEPMLHLMGAFQVGFIFSLVPF